MQRQMFDQFQQVMTTVLQMFTTMHRDQVGLLREEIDGLRRLTQELHELRAEPPARGGGTPDVPLTGSAEATSPERPRLPASGPRPDPDPAQDRAGPPSALGTTSRQAGRAEEPPEVHSLAEGPARTARDSGGPGDPAVRSDAEFHVLLTRRIAAIQQEQQSRWQRILGLVTGPKQGGPTL
jgi:hypothetical protein